MDRDNGDVGTLEVPCPVNTKMRVHVIVKCAAASDSQSYTPEQGTILTESVFVYLFIDHPIRRANIVGIIE